MASWQRDYKEKMRPESGKRHSPWLDQDDTCWCCAFLIPWEALTCCWWLIGTPALIGLVAILAAQL